MPIQNGNYLEINFLTCRFPVGNLQKINQNQKFSWHGIVTVVFYALSLHETERKCKFKLTFIFINKNIADRW